MQFHSRRTAPVALAVLAIAFSTATFAAPQAQPPLTSEKDKVSYAIGMQMGMQLANSLAPVKDDVDTAVLMRAISTSLAGGKTAMTIPEAQATLSAFGKKVQARQQAAQQAAGAKNLSEGSAFLSANKTKPGVKTTASGLQYMVVHAGNGPKPKATDSVKVNYVGSTLDGKVFDSSEKNGGPAVMSLGSVIPGWTEGVQLMPVGSKYEFWIPAPLAYGEKGTPGGPIGPNATLHFQIELVSIGAK